MNGYKLMADSYKKLAEQGKISKEDAEKEIRIFEFLATCDTDDFCIMVDSSAFNDIIKGYLKLAVNNAGLDKKSKDRMMNELGCLFDEKNAKDVLQGDK